MGKVTLESRHEPFRLKICSLSPEALQNQEAEPLGRLDRKERVVAVVKDREQERKDRCPAVTLLRLALAPRLLAVAIRNL